MAKLTIPGMQSKQEEKTVTSPLMIPGMKSMQQNYQDIQDRAESTVDVSSERSSIVESDPQDERATKIKWKDSLVEDLEVQVKKEQNSLPQKELVGILKTSKPVDLISEAESLKVSSKAYLESLYDNDPLAASIAQSKAKTALYDLQEAQANASKTLKELANDDDNSHDAQDTKDIATPTADGEHTTRHNKLSGGRFGF